MSRVTPKPVTYELCYLEIKISYMKGELQIEIFSIEQSVLNLRTFLLFPKAFYLFPCPQGAQEEEVGVSGRGSVEGKQKQGFRLPF